MTLTQKSWAAGLISSALLGALGVSAQTTDTSTTNPQTSPSRSFTTDLATAMLAKDGVAEPTPEQLSSAEADIQARRDSGMGWGQIANVLGLNLGAVVSAANRAQPAARDTAQAKKSAESGQMGQMGQSATASSRSDSGAGNSGGKGGGNSGGNGGGGNSGGGGRGK